MKTREQLRDELRQIEESYVKDITPAKQKRAREIIKILNECVCRQCGCRYDNLKSRAAYKGFCTAKCLHARAKYHGYRKNGTASEYRVLKNANDVGDVYVLPIPMPPETMVGRIVKALQRTHGHIQEGLSEEEYRSVGEQGIYELSADCYLEMHGNDNEACKVFWDLSDEAQESLLKKAFPYYKKES